MKNSINEMCRLAGLSEMSENDGHIVESVGYKFPRSKKELDPKTPENIKKRVICLEKATKYLNSALMELGRCPRLDFMQDISDISSDMSEVLNGEGGNGGLANLTKIYKKES